MAQLVKNLPAVWETWVRSLGCDPCNLWSAPDWFLLPRWHGVMTDGLRLSELGYLDHSVSLPFLPSFLLTFKFTEGRSCVSKSLKPQLDSVPWTPVVLRTIPRAIIPLLQVNELRPEKFKWLVQGHLTDKLWGCPPMVVVLLINLQVSLQIWDPRTVHTNQTYTI